MNKPKSKINEEIQTEIKRPFPRLQTEVKGTSKTKQSFADETNINKIMAKYKSTGQMPVLNNKKPNFGFAPSYDFRAAMETIVKMQDEFNKLPAKTRQEFDYDPALFLEFCENEENAEELAEMGLIQLPPTPTPPATVPGVTDAQEEPPKEPPAPTPPKAE